MIAVWIVSDQMDFHFQSKHEPIRLGASHSKIMGVLLADMLKWVLLANLIAWPLAWYAAGLWLDSFAYRITISPHYFIAAGLASVLTTALVIVSQSYREILQNPVEGLKGE